MFESTLSTFAILKTCLSIFRFSPKYHQGDATWLGGCAMSQLTPQAKRVLEG
jgi:hypothetical protein